MVWLMRVFEVQSGRLRIAVFAALVVVSLHAGTAGAQALSSGNSPTSPRLDLTRWAGPSYRVGRILSGDRLTISSGDSEWEVCLLGIEAARWKVCVEELRRLLEGETVAILYGTTARLDRAGRVLAYVVRRSDGLFVNAALVARGYATLAEPLGRYGDLLDEAQRQARADDRGLWVDGNIYRSEPWSQEFKAALDLSNRRAAERSAQRAARHRELFDLATGSPGRGFGTDGSSYRAGKYGQAQLALRNATGFDLDLTLEPSDGSQARSLKLPAGKVETLSLPAGEYLLSGSVRNRLDIIPRTSSLTLRAGESATVVVWLN